ncbi:GtrA family protein [Xanthomonas sp. LF06-19]|uniref:GtrA family protein n=1 Tax=Xanthomonas sp. LF06-19 TaxID=3097551 RepID=UPI0025FE15AA|nr:GtrA family protein [Xanthomonas sp. LF06-19]MDY4282475.1 GtrA family protein [Xanthomonas sp. LF06-19]
MQRLWQLFNSPSLRPLRFIAVGGAATCVHLTVAMLISFSLPNVSVYLANLVAFMLAFGVSCLGHRHVTFQRRGSSHRFFVIAAAGFMLNNLILAIGTQAGLNRHVALAIAVIIVPALSYFASSLWAFTGKN